MLYLTAGSPYAGIIGLAAFLPQLILIVVCSLKFHKDPPMAFFLNTFIFVTFNKVCTSQVNGITFYTFFSELLHKDFFIPCWELLTLKKILLHLYSLFYYVVWLSYMTLSQSVFDFSFFVFFQYFLWYLCLLPLVLPSLTMSISKGITLIVAWLLGQVSCFIIQLNFVWNIA